MNNANHNKAEARAAYLASLSFPSTPWTDEDRRRFAEASDRWDSLWASEYGV